MKKYLVSIGVLVLLAIFFLPCVRVFALDANDEIPSLNWGSPSASWTSGSGQKYTVYFQGVSDQIINGESHATDVMRNVAPATLPNLLFDSKCITDAKDTDISQTKCINFDFVHYQNPVGTKLLNSHTYVDGYLKSATAVIKYPSINVFGDSYNASGNFGYWGRHLRQTTCNLATDPGCNSNAYEQIGSYQFNPNAQAYWNSGDNATMTETIARLKQNTKVLPNPSLSGTFFGICGSSVSCSDVNQYPDGRVWRSNSAVSVNGLNYKQKSTVIITAGNLTIDGSVLSSPTMDQNLSIGFIVENGNVTITNTTGSKTIRASIFAPKGTITISGRNIELTGSFVAKDFNIPSSSSGINFIQDTRPESTWPPGFRDLLSLKSESK